MLDWWDGSIIIGIIASSTLSAGIALAVVRYGAKLQLARDRSAAAATRKSDQEHLAKSLHAELVVIWDRYQEAIGNHLKAAAKPEDFGHLTFTSNFFVVFDGNTAKLGLFEPEDVRSVVSAYVYGKAMIDSLVIWSKTIDRVDSLWQTSMLPGVSHQAGAATKASLQELVPYLTTLKNLHDEVEKRITEAKSALEKYFPPTIASPATEKA